MCCLRAPASPVKAKGGGPDGVGEGNIAEGLCDAAGGVDIALGAAVGVDSGVGTFVDVAVKVGDGVGVGAGWGDEHAVPGSAAKTIIVITRLNSLFPDEFSFLKSFCLSPWLRAKARCGDYRDSTYQGQ